MKRPAVLVLLALVLIVVALAALDLLPLGFFGGSDGEDRGGTGDLLETDAGDGEATLAGRKGKKQDPFAGFTEVMDPASFIPSTVKGGTPGGGVVRGRVVQEKGGIPVVDVIVTLHRPDSLIAYLRAEANGRFDTLEASTGADGVFTFTDVTPSEGYALRALHPDYAVTSHPKRLDLRGRGTHDVGDLKLGPGATLTGRVVDEQENPVAGARVVVTWRLTNALNIVLVHPDTAPEIEREGVTDEKGRYTIDKLEPAPKTVFAEGPNGAADVKISISLKPGQVRELKDFVLPGDRSIAGTVVWKNGGGVKGARVFAAPWQQPAMRSAEADDEGRFRLTWLPEVKEYALGVLVEGLPVQYVEGIGLGRDDVVVEFDPPGALKGVVVQAATGKPVTRFGIQLDDSVPSEDFLRQMVETQVKRGLGPAPFQSDTGSFQFPRVAAGSYVVNVHAPGFPTIKHEGVVIVAGETAEIRVEIPKGNTARGRVESAAGDPVSGARIFVFSAGSIKEDVTPVRLTGYTRDREPTEASRADGTFTLPPQTPGRYDLIVDLDDALPGLLRGVDLADGDVGGLVVRLPPSGRVKGLILDESARPAAGEEIYVLYPNGVVRTFHADEEGRFEAGGLPVGRCLVRWVQLNDADVYNRFIRSGDEQQKEAAYDELRLKGEEHVLTDGQVTQVTIRLPGRTKVTGRLRVAGAPPPEDHRDFYVTVEGGGRWIRVEGDENGEFETHLPAGKYLVFAVTSEGRYESLEIVIPDAPTHILDVDMP